jgi:hypothetical protein
MAHTSKPPLHSERLIRKSRCIARVPCALEGYMRREIHSAGLELIDVSHGSVVALHFSGPETLVAALIKRVNDAGWGQIQWQATPS